MWKQVDSTVVGSKVSSRPRPPEDLSRGHLRLVYSRPRAEIVNSSWGQQVDRLALQFRSRHSGSAVREDWPAWLKGAALWELAVLAAMLTLLLMVGRRKSAWS